MCWSELANAELQQGLGVLGILWCRTSLTTEANRPTYSYKVSGSERQLVVKTQNLAKETPAGTQQPMPTTTHRPRICDAGSARGWRDRQLILSS